MSFGFTYTLPTITDSHSDFPVELKTVDFPSAAIDGTANAIDNGGGNLRAYTDSGKGTQLSVHIVTFVSSGSPDADVRIKIPTAATNNTIFIEADSVASTQPAVGDAFGRNSVYTNDDQRFLFQGDTGSTITDITGNDDMSEQGVSAVGAVIAPFGSNSTNLNGAAYYDGATDPTLGAGQMAVRLWFHGVETGVASGISGSFVSNSDVSFLFFITSGDIASFRVPKVGVTTGVNSTTTVQPDTTFHLAGLYDGTNVKILVDGTVEDTTARTGVIETPSTSSLYNVGSWNNNSTDRRPDARFQEYIISTSTNVTEDYLKTEYDNQSSVGAWGTVGAWVDSGISLTSVYYQTLMAGN